MIVWRAINDESLDSLEVGREYLVTDGYGIYVATFTRPFSEKSIVVWYSRTTKSVINSNLTHYTELNFPQK